MSTKSNSSNTPKPHAPRKKASTPSPRILTLRDLPEMIFARISNESEILHETSADFFWSKISIYRHPEVSELSLAYSATVKKIAVRGSSIATWISYCKGYISDSFCILISEYGLDPESNNLRFELKPILIIEAGYQIPVQDQAADYQLEETAGFEKIRYPRFLETRPKRIIELQRHILSIYRRQFDVLPRRKRRNPLYDPTR